MFAATRRHCAAYVATEYCAGGFVIRIGARSRGVERLLGGHRWAAFMTAANPQSRIATPGLNARRNARLVALLRMAGFRRVAGSARDPQGSWPDEPSALVVGIAPARAAAVARRWRQNAIVVVRRGAVATLHALR